MRVGFTGSATSELLPTLVRAYADRYPDVKLEVHSDMVTPRQTEQLLDDRLSVGVLRPPVSIPGLAVETIRSEPVVVILASRHPATVHRHLDLAELRDEWFVSYPNDPPSTMYSIMRGPRERRLQTPHPPDRRRQRRPRRRAPVEAATPASGTDDEHFGIEF
jgi:DNA-binding transcriptional LysR family regulator